MNKQEQIFDIFIVGGGVNGCGIARDAAGRGFSVCLAEMNDLASATSSGSTKLIHGGLRYLEHYKFGLVRQSLNEREILWKIAPHIIRPLRFVLPLHSGMRPAWFLRLGLFFYDYLGGRRLLSGTRTINLHRDQTGKPLKPIFKKAFEYSDCWVDDARLVVLNARDAADRGAVILPRTRVVDASRDSGMWRVLTEDASGVQKEWRARSLVNATGPWADRFLSESLEKVEQHRVRLVQGSHIVVPRIFSHDRCYIFQNADNRIIFAIPYEDDFTLIGTTDLDYEDNPAKVKISNEEITYLCNAVSEYFVKKLSPDEVVWSYSAVRPLYDDSASRAQEATRDYVLRSEGSVSEAPLINVFGGKITTYRRLAESALHKIEEFLQKSGQAWTHKQPLPGGELVMSGLEDLCFELREEYPFLEKQHAKRLARSYGTLARKFLAKSKSYADLGVCFGADLYEAELQYLADFEWALSAEDVLWRRSKLGLRIDKKSGKAIDKWFAARGD